MARHHCEPGLRSSTHPDQPWPATRARRRRALRVRGGRRSASQPWVAGRPGRDGPGLRHRQDGPTPDVLGCPASSCGGSTCPHEAPRTYPHSALPSPSWPRPSAAIRVQEALDLVSLRSPYRLCLAHALRRAGHRVTLEASLDIAFEGLLVPEATASTFW